MQKFSKIKTDNKDENIVTVKLDAELLERAGIEKDADVVVEALDGKIEITPVFRSVR